MLLPLLLSFMLSENEGTFEELLALEFDCDNENDCDEDLVLFDSSSNNHSNGNDGSESAELLTQLRSCGIPIPTSKIC